MIDTEVAELIGREEERQKETITLIPSENYASAAVREAVGSVLSNKYAEGYPGRRYYQGNGIIDEIENLAIERTKRLFGVPHANVQPYSGSPANAAVLLALVGPGEKVMGMKLAAGGHLTHGHSVSFSGRFFPAVQYDVDENGLVDYGEMEKMALVEKPKLLVVGATAYPRIFDWQRVGEIGNKTGAYILADISHIAGLVAAGEHPSPVPFVDVVMTTTHKTLRGPRGAVLLVTEKGLAKDADLAKKIDKAVFPGMQGGPHENVVAGIAMAMAEAATPEFRQYAKQVVKNARELAAGLMKLGYKITTGGTDNHLMLIDLVDKGLTGKEAAVALEEAGIVTNANAIPHDPNPPLKPSGLRVGTPAVTTRGMKEPEMKLIAELMERALRGEKEQVRAEVKKLGMKFPVPG